MADLDGFYRGKRVLVTGHTGFKGSWLTQWLLEMGATVAGYSDVIPTQPSLFEVLGLSEQIRDFRGDVREPSALQKCFQEFEPEVVFHLAAQPLVRLSYEDPVGTLSTNVIGTANLMQAVRGCPSVRVLVNVTSDKCYENREWEYSYRENDPMGGRDPYSASKGCAELVFSSFARSFFIGKTPVVVTARAGNVIGGGDWSKDRIVVDCVKSWGEGKPVLLRNPSATRPWQHVLDCLSGYLKLARCAWDDPAQFNGEAFNFGPTHGEGGTVLELVSTMSAHWPESSWKLEGDAEGQPHEAKFLRLNCDKSSNILGWSSSWNLQQSARATTEWYSDYYYGGALRERTLKQIAQFEREMISRAGLPYK
jgi:CDP-glucose 4,6-dehydratase